MTSATGDLSIEAQTRYAFIRTLIQRDFAPPAQVIELGAAPGDQIAALARLGYEATAVDIGIASDAWASATAGRMAALLDDAGVSYVEWNLEETPYPLAESDYDAVVMTEVFEHLRDYPVRSLLECKRILRPAGRLYLTTPNVAYLRNRVVALRGGAVASPLHDWIGGLPHARHAREYTFDEMRTMLEHAGFTPLEMTSRHFFKAQGRPVARAAKSAVDALSRLRPTFGPSIVVVAKPL